VSFTWFADSPLRSREDVAREIHKVSLARDLDEFATVLACMCVATEVGTGDSWWCPANPSKLPDSLSYPHDSLSDDGRSVGYFQQQPGPRGEAWWGTTANMMTLAESADSFLSRLADDYGDAKGSPVLAGQFVQRVQGSSYPDRYAQHWDEAWDVVNRALGKTAVEEVVEVANGRPDFNEYPKWSPSRQPRFGVTPDLFLLHTQEGDGNADSLANYLCNPSNRVSYHYTVSQADDGGVTVVDVVDTDYASWSVLSANNRSINLCFAGSRASWSRQEWMEHSRAIEVAAWLAVQDCKQWGIDTRVLAPPYDSDPPGISDHKYVTEYLGDGNHTDVGHQFPWDFFQAAVNRFANNASPEGGDMFTDDDRNMLKELVEIRRHSRSPLRHLGEGEVDTIAGFAWTTDGLAHAQFVAMAASYGHAESIRLLVEVAAADLGRFPDRQSDANLARAILADIEARKPEVLQQFLKGT
jgi:hypothetical protein